jgi:SET domain-containing protein
MMLVPVRADRSPIHGLGLFATAAIPAGTPVWRFEPGFDQVFDVDRCCTLPDIARRHMQHYGYLDASTGRWVLNGDLAIFLNHAANPNTGALGQTGAAAMTVALRDIAAGEELTCDYRAFDASGKPVG